MKSLLLLVALLFILQCITAQNTWVQKTDFGGTARRGAAGFSIGTKGYMGTGDDGIFKKDFWEYNPTTGTWTQKTDFGGTGRYGAVGFSIGTKGYIGTGFDGSYKKDFWEYDPSANVWTQKTDFSGTARYGAAGFSIGTKGYIGTGFDGSIVKKDFWEYDPSANTWTQKTDFGGTARYGTAGFSIGTKGYIGTGLDVGGYKKDFWEYDPSIGPLGTWAQKTDFGGTARYDATGFSIGTKGYIGTGDDGIDKKDFWEYDQSANTWTQKTDFGGIARNFAVGFSIGTKGYIGTGYDGSSYKKDFWEYAPDIPGAALNFDGVDDKVVVTNSTANLANISFSVEMWLKRNSTGTTDIAFSQGGGINNNGTLHIGFRGNGAFTFAFYNNDLDVFGYSDLLWHHWACTFDNITKIQRIYRDGVLVGQRTATSSFVGSGNTNLYIGDAAYGSTFGAPNVFDGTIDEVRVWNTTRTCDQVSQLRNCELTGSESGLLAYYKFNQGVAGGNNAGVTTLTDATANGNNGTLNNFALTGATSNWVAPGGVTSGASCSPVTAPEINVQGNGNTIDDGDVTPSATDNTDFGNVNPGSNSVITFTVQNTGTAPLIVTGITVTGTDASSFVPGALTLPSPIPAGNSATFTLTFTPTSTGLKNATVHIASNDCDEADYDYAVQGNGSYPSNIRYVTQTGAGAKDGSSWSNAYGEAEFQPNLNSAAPGLEFWVAAGTYKPTGTATRTISFVIPSSVSMYGGFAGGETLRSQRNPATNVTTLSGDIGSATVVTDNSYHVVNLTSVNTITFDGFTIRDGYANTDLIERGAGIFISNSSTLTLDNLIIINNEAKGASSQTGNGGGIYIQSSTVNIIIQNSSFQFNKANFFGGGIYILFGATVTFNNCNFTSNSAVLGGGMKQNGVTTINNCIFKANIANGGGVDNSGTATINKSFFYNNIAANNVGGAGAGTGGALQNNSNTATLTNCVLANNAANGTNDDGGGGIMVYGGTVNLTNCTLSENTTASTAKPNGNSISVVNGGGSTPVANLKNTIVWGAATKHINNEVTINYTNSLVKGEALTCPNKNIDPLFVNPADPDGADNIFGTPDDGLMISNTSPAKNAGTSAGAPADDVVGTIRPQGTEVDMGAYEVVEASSVGSPEINVTGNGVTIVDGDATPSTADHTDFGNVTTGTNTTRTYTIQNTGSSPLNITGITIAGDASFTLGALTPASPVPAGASATFMVTFAPSTTGPKTATVNIASNDCDEATYDYAIQGTGIIPLSTNADLSNLVLSQGTLAPPFASGTTAYSASVPNSTTSITETPTAADPTATITVNGTPVASGSPSGSIPLAVGGNIITTVVTAQDGTTMKTYTVNVTRACPSDVDHQAYIANTTSGNQAWRGELGMEFTVNSTSGILIKQLGAFDDGGNGITGLQSGGVRVAIFNKSTHNIVPGLNIVITGNGDHYTGNHRMADITPVTLPRGDYVLVAKGYHAGEHDGSGLFPPGDDGSGAITFGTEVSYGLDDPNGFSYPPIAYGGSPHAWNAGTFVFTSVIPCGGGPSNNANLSNLVLSQGTLTPSFAQNTTSYTSSVPNGTASITVTPTTADAGATITVNGTPVSSGSPSNPIALAVGNNIINTVVTAADGTTTKTYTINVNRAAAGPSTNANLSNLVLSQGTLVPPFAQNTTSYTATVPNSTASIMITPTAAEAGASITVNGTPVASGSPSGPIALAVGVNPAAVIQVTAPDGTTTKTYTVTITRDAPGGSCESSPHQAYTSNTTSGNEPWRGELGMQFIVNNPGGIIVKQLGAFDDGGNGITGLQSGGVRVAIFNRSTQTLVPGLNVIITGNGDHYTGNHRLVDLASPVTLPPGDYVIVAKGYHSGERTRSGSFPLGDNGGAITFGNEVSYGPDNPVGFAYPVTAYSGDPHAWLAGTMIFTVPISCGGGPSNNANLSNLVLSQGTLTPPFAQGTTNYTATVPNSTTSITVTPTAADPGATITVNGTPVASGSPSAPIALAVGSNPPIDVQVTAADGTTIKHYLVTVTRNAAGPSNNANLSNLVLSQGTLTPPFAQGTTNYTATVPNSTSSITVTPTAADPGATITVNGTPVASGSPSAPIALAVGSNPPIDVQVTAADGTTIKHYLVTVTRSAPGAGCESSPVQAYTTNLTDGNEPWQGELGMQFIVNNASGIIIKQLGAFDDGANGITGLQSGGVRVAIFNRSTMTIVPGLNVVIAGLADHYTGNHRMVDLASPVTLPPGDYVIVAKGYHNGERTRSGSFTPGNTGGGAITFGNEVSYGPNNPAGFNYPVTAYGGDAHAWLAGTMVFTVPVACPAITKVDAKAEAETIELTDLKVSPNPTNGQFNLQLIDYGVKKVDIQVMDQNGKIVEQKTISLTGKTPLMNIPFNLTNRAAGMYFIRVIDSDGVKTGKVVMQR